MSAMRVRGQGHWPRLLRLFSSISTMTTGRSVASRGCSTWKKSKTRTRSSCTRMGSASRSAASPMSSRSASPRAKPNRRANRASHFIENRLQPGEATPRSFLPERPHELVLQGLDQIRHHAALAGLNESLDRHAWDELDLAEPRDLAFRHGNTGVVVRLTGALVGRGVGGNARDRAVDFRRCAQIERRETQHCRLTNLNLVDVARIDLGLDLQVVRFRNDQHDGV